ncbi:MAG: NAD(P)H-hydrate dehydratase [Chloroflexi bacterium]|nr:NAD(P)H-hydrate dehydratase [Chloroflexota bacterium]
MKILTADRMRQAEADCARIGKSTAMLMENAGKTVAEEIKRILGTLEGQNILILVGPGNNGGDGLVAARCLHGWDTQVSLYLVSTRPADDANLKMAREHGLPIIDAANDENLDSLDNLLSTATVIVDAIFGTGKNRPLAGVFAQVLDRVRAVKENCPAVRIFALDLPSGLDADTGAADPACLYADYTITLGFPKPGLFQFPGAERVGRLSVVDIGIPPSLVENVPDEMITAGWTRSVLPLRPPGANKGTFGRVLVVAGSINYIGAAYLACNGAMRVGAGLVTLATPASLQPIMASKLTETVHLPLPESGPGVIAPEAARLINHSLSQYDVLLMGCGLGQSPATARLIRSVLLRKVTALPLVLDADALNILAKVPDWWQKLSDNAILTPHPGEMSRLTGIPVEEIQRDRIGVTKKMAYEWGKIVVLKGAYTVVASTDGRCRLNPFANPGLASAGTGDVLSGVIAGLAAQGMPLFDAASAGVYLHAVAGEHVRDRLGDAGMVASDLLPELPVAIRRLKEGTGKDNAAGI